MHSKSVRIIRLLLITIAFIFFISDVYPAAAQSDKSQGQQYRPTVIVDAGHGGADGGAVSISGEKESVINLDISKRLELILAFFGTDVIMTRTDETLQYSDKSNTIRAKKVEDQKRRLSLINTTPNAVLISVHQNIYPSQSPCGAQVLYAPTNGSKVFAEYMQKLMITTLGQQNKRAASKIPDSILIFNNIKCPAVLIECGFLSNPNEEQLLMTDSYRLKLAAIIAAGYLFNENDLSNIIVEGTNENKNSVLLHRLRQ